MKLADLHPGPLAIMPDALAGLDARIAAIAGLHGALDRAGVSPLDRSRAAAGGGSSIIPEITSDGTAIVTVAGELLPSVPWWLHAYDLGLVDLGHLRAALADLVGQAGVQRVTLRMASPGGSVAGTAEAAQAVRALEAAGKPVTVEAIGVVASAAYWIAAQASRIIASPTAVIGSLGVYSVLVDTTAADAAAGLRYRLISTGAKKGLGADGAITDAQVAEAQQRINAVGDLFAQAVAAGRRLDRAAVDQLFTGQVWLADEARALGLIDAVSFPAGVIAPATTPAATAADSTEHAMQALTVPELAAIQAAHPTLASAIAAEATTTPTHTKASLDAWAQRAAVTAERDTLAADLAAERTAHAATKASLAAVTAERDQATALAGIAKGAGRDPGPDGAHADTVAGDAFLAMTPHARNAFVARGGQVAR